MSQCTAQVYDTFGPGGRYPCTYKAKVQREGKGYCGVHDPVRKAARDAERHTRWAAEFKARTKADMERGRKLRTWDGLVEALEVAATGFHALANPASRTADANKRGRYNAKEHEAKLRVALEEVKP